MIYKQKMYNIDYQNIECIFDLRSVMLKVS